MRSQAPGWRHMSEPGHGERALPDAWWQEYRSPNGGGPGALPQSTMEARALLAESAGGARGGPSWPAADPNHSECNLSQGRRTPEMEVSLSHDHAPWLTI